MSREEHTSRAASLIAQADKGNLPGYTMARILDDAAGHLYAAGLHRQAMLIETRAIHAMAL